MLIFQVKASEIVHSDFYQTNYTLRFPRIEKVRYDKPWSDCLTTEEFTELRQVNIIVDIYVVRKKTTYFFNHSLSGKENWNLELTYSNNVGWAKLFVSPIMFSVILSTPSKQILAFREWMYEETFISTNIFIICLIKNLFAVHKVYGRLLFELFFMSVDCGIS